MMSKKAFDDIQSTITAIRDGQFSSIYIVSGTEDFMVFRSRTLIADALLRRVKNGSIEILNGRENTISDVISVLNSPSLFEPFKVVVVRDAPYFKTKLSDRDAGKFKDWMDRVSDPSVHPSAVLICTCEKVDRRIALIKKIEKLGVLLEFKPSESYERGDIKRDPYYPIILKQLQDAGILIRREAWQKLRHRAANNLWSVVNAVDVLIAYVQGRPEILEKDIEAVIAGGDDLPVFAVTEAMGTRNPKQLRDSLQRLLETGTAPLMILKMLTSRIRMMLISKSLIKNADSVKWNASMEYWRFRQAALPGLKQKLESNPTWSRLASGQHPYALFTTLKQSEKFTSAELEACLVELSTVDLALKSTVKSPLVLLEIALLPLCRMV
jgi:DNA polymerase III subunit delta